MLISLSEALETPVSTLLGETVVETEADSIKAISEKLEVINLQLAQRKTTRRKVLHVLCISVCAVIVAIFVVLALIKSPYLGWDYMAPETMVLGVVFHALEWGFVRVAPIIFVGALIGGILTRKRLRVTARMISSHFERQENKTPSNIEGHIKGCRPHDFSTRVP